jgi:CRP-like cAMP-binding protein
MVKQIEIGALEFFPLWRGLPHDLLGRVAQHMRVASAPGGQAVIAQGEESKGVFFLSSGQLKVWEPGDEHGKEVILGLVTPGGMFGERSIIDGSPHHANISVLRDAVLLHLPPEAAAFFFFSEPLVARRLMQRLSSLVDEANTHRRAFSARNAGRRLWRVLESLARSDGERRVIEHLPTQEELAQLSGLARETVSRLLSLWRNNGYTLKSGRRMQLRAGPGPE